MILKLSAESWNNVSTVLNKKLFAENCVSVGNSDKFGKVSMCCIRSNEISLNEVHHKA